jgi:thiol-disulfide isomerase/thioredoxin
MLFNESCKIDAENLSVFFENSTDSIAKTRVKQLLSDKKLLPNNCTFPGFDLVSISGDSTSINQLINGKKSVVYFWSSDYSSNEYIGKRIHYLTKKYPELFFVGINISEEAASKPYSIKKLDNQYTLTKNSKGKTLVSSQYPRAILINADGKVVNNFTLLTNSRIEKQLQQLITQE